jgi:hypothetical protein
LTVASLFFRGNVGPGEWADERFVGSACGQGGGKHAGRASLCIGSAFMAGGAFIAGSAFTAGGAFMAGSAFHR